MNVYKKMYYRLFNEITDALKEDDIEVVREILKQAQISTEEIFMQADED